MHAKERMMQIHLIGFFDIIFCLKIILPMLKMTKSKKIIFKGVSENSNQKTG